MFHGISEQGRVAIDRHIPTSRGLPHHGHMWEAVGWADLPKAVKFRHVFVDGLLFIPTPASSQRAGSSPWRNDECSPVTITQSWFRAVDAIRISSVPTI